MEAGEPYAAAESGAPALYAQTASAAAAEQLQRQVQQWAKVIDVAEAEINRKATEVAWLKQRLRTTEWESLAAQREAHTTREQLAKTTQELEAAKRDLHVATNGADPVVIADKARDELKAMDEQWRAKYVAAVDEAEKLQDVLNTKETAFAAEIAEARTQLERFDAKLNEREAQLAKLSRELMEARMSTSDGTHEMDALRASKRRLNETLENTAARLREVEANNAGLTSRVRELEAALVAEKQKTENAERLAVAAAAEARADEAAKARRRFEDDLRVIKSAETAAAPAPAPPASPKAKTKAPAPAPPPPKSPPKSPRAKAPPPPPPPAPPPEENDKAEQDAAARKIQKMRRDSIAVRKAKQEKERLKQEKANASLAGEGSGMKLPTGERKDDETRAKEAAEMRKPQKMKSPWPPPPMTKDSPSAAPPPPAAAPPPPPPKEEKPTGPHIERFVISNDALVGNTVTAKGAMRNCKKCRFMWHRKESAGDSGKVVAGMKRPGLVLTAADVGAVYSVEATPVGEDGKKGAVSNAATNEVMVPPALQAAAQRRVDGGSPPLAATDTATGRSATLALRPGQVVVVANGADALTTSLDPGHAPKVMLERGAPNLVVVPGTPGAPTVKLAVADAKLRDEFALAVRIIAPRVGVFNMDTDGGDALAIGSLPEASNAAAGPSSSAEAGSKEPKDKAKVGTRTKRGDTMAPSFSAAQAVLDTLDPEGAEGAGASTSAPSSSKEEPEASKQKTSLDKLPGIRDLKIFSTPAGSSPMLGNLLTATGYPLNGTTLCLFQWRRRKPEEEAWKQIPDATMPQYTPGCDDAGCILSVQCMPTDAEGVSGVAVEVDANNGRPIPLPQSLGELVNKCLVEGSGTFPATLKANGDVVQIKVTSKDLAVMTGPPRFKKAVHKVPMEHLTSIGVGVGSCDAVFGITNPNARPPSVVCEVAFAYNDVRDAAVLVARAFKGAFSAAGGAPADAKPKRGWFG